MRPARPRPPPASRPGATGWARRRGRLPRADRMDGILDAAQAVFCDKGYDGATVAEVASRLGVVEGTVFKYFPSKRALLLAVLERWYLGMVGDYARDLAGVEGAAARLRLLVFRHLRSLRDHPQLCRLMFREVRSGGDYRGSRLHELNRRYAGLLTGVVEEGVRQGEFRAGAPAALLRDLVFGGIEHHAWNYFEGRGRLDVEGITRSLMALVLGGIATREPPSSPRRKPGSNAFRRSRTPDAGLRRHDAR